MKADLDMLWLTAPCSVQMEIPRYLKFRRVQCPRYRLESHHKVDGNRDQGRW